MPFPIHGEYRHMMAQKDTGRVLGNPEGKHFACSIRAMCWRSDEESAKVIDHVQSGGVLVDGLGVGDVGNIVLRDRQNLAQNGIIIVVLTLEKYSATSCLSGPDIVSRGFVYVRESEDLMEEAQAMWWSMPLQTAWSGTFPTGARSRTLSATALSDFLWKRIKRNPMILPIIMECITTVPKDGTKEPYEQTDKGNQ